MQDVFDAKIKHLYKSDDERFVIHGSIVIEDVEVMVYDDSDLLKSGKKMPVVTYIYVTDVVALRAKAIEKGFKPVKSYFQNSIEAENMFWGDFCASVEDPYGHVWTFSQKHDEGVDKEELKKNEEAWKRQYDAVP